METIKTENGFLLRQLNIDKLGFLVFKNNDNIDIIDCNGNLLILDKDILYGIRFSFINGRIIKFTSIDDLKVLEDRIILDSKLLSNKIGISYVDLTKIEILFVEDIKN